jgi:hypothetical protein
MSTIKDKSKTMADSMNRSLKKNDTFIPPQRSNSRKQKSFFNECNKKLRSSNESKISEKGFRATEKQFNKGKLDDKHV